MRGTTSYDIKKKQDTDFDCKIADISEFEVEEDEWDTWKEGGQKATHVRAKKSKFKKNGNKKKIEILDKRGPVVDWRSIHRMRLKSLMPGSCRADTDWSTLIHIDRHHMFNNWIRKSRDCLWTDRRKKQAWKITPVQTGHQMQNSFRQQRTNALGHYERHWLDSELLGWECCNQDCRSCNDSQKRTSSKTRRGTCRTEGNHH